MSKYVAKCDRCGKLFRANMRKRLTVYKETQPGYFTTDSFIRYYCDECASKAKAAIIEFERGDA